MKTLKRLLLFTTCICFLTTCSKDNDFFGGGQNDLNYKVEKYCKPYHGLDQDRYVVMRSTGLRVHYRIIGKGPIDMVFIPGWTNPLEIYTKQFDFFRDKARCIYIDVPGQGLSDAPEGIDYTMGLMADAIYDVVRKEGVKKFVGVGFSMGPIPLGQFEKKHPGMITKLVNIEGSYTPWPTEEPARSEFLYGVDGLYTFLDWMLGWGPDEKMFLGSLLVPPDAPDDLKEFVEYFYDFPTWLMHNIYYWCNMEEVNKPVGWKIPILSIYIADPDPVNEALIFPNSHVEVIGGSGHCVQWEKYELVNRHIWKFISDRPGRRY
jgi:pimeloyl-ACP methyl ester carboxylesterase